MREPSLPGLQASRPPGPAFPQAPSEFRPALQEGCLLFLPGAEYLPPPSRFSHRSCCLHSPHPCLHPMRTSLLQNPTGGPVVPGSAWGPWLPVARCPHHFPCAQGPVPPTRGPCRHVLSLVGVGAPGGPKSSSRNNSRSGRSSSWAHRGPPTRCQTFLVLSHSIRTVTQGGGRVIPTLQMRKLRPGGRRATWPGYMAGEGQSWDLAHACPPGTTPPPPSKGSTDVC